jgi:hypothetical protein
MKWSDEIERELREQKQREATLLCLSGLLALSIGLTIAKGMAAGLICLGIGILVLSAIIAMASFDGP